jgi:excisionase family DNA binding protein
MNDEVLTIEEAAQLLKVNPETVRRWIRRGELPVIKRGSIVRILKSTLLAEQKDAA